MEHVYSHTLKDGTVLVQHARGAECVAQFYCANEFVARIARGAENFVDMQFAVDAMNDYVKRGGKHQAE